MYFCFYAPRKNLELRPRRQGPVGVLPQALEGLYNQDRTAFGRVQHELDCLKLHRVVSIYTAQNLGNSFMLPTGLNFEIIIQLGPKQHHGVNQSREEEAIPGSEGKEGGELVWMKVKEHPVLALGSQVRLDPVRH